MSDDATSGLDPRFDPRYQRGYSGGEASTTNASPARAGVDRVPDPPATAAAAPEPMVVRTSRAGPEPAAVGESVSVPGPPPAAEPAAAVDDFELFADGAGPSGPSARGWLFAGWVVTAAVFAVGVFLSWAVNSDVGYYTGAFSNEDQWFRELGWTLSPSLLMAGAIGAVVVTVLAAFASLRDDTRATAEAGARFGRGAAWWALVGIGTAAAVGLVWVIGRMFEGSNANGSLMLDGNGNPADSADQAEVFAQIALGQFAQAMIGPLALAVVAAFVGLVAVEVRRATVSAARARSAQPDRP